MQRAVHWLPGQFRAILAGFLAALTLVLSVFASSYGLHLTLHKGESAGPHGHCAVCSVAQGEILAAASVQLESCPPLAVAWLLPSQPGQSVTGPDHSLASSRGPPVFIASV